ARGGPRGNLIGLTSSPSSGPDTLTLLKALKRRWLLALSLGTVAAVAATAAAWFLLSPRFTVAAQLLVAEPPPIVPRDNRENRNQSTMNLKTLAGSIKRRDVLMAALKRDDVKRLDLVRQQPDPLLWLEDELKVEFPEGSEIAKPTMIGDDPDQMVTLIDGVVQEFLKLTVDAERELRSTRLRKLEEAYNNSQ